MCPEVEVGMGVPREPVHLVRRDSSVHLVGSESGRDWTEPLRAWAASRLASLGGVQGWVFKSKSPSCGLSVAVAGGDAGPGLFALTVRTVFPDLPCQEEQQLEDPAVRAAFLEAVRSRG